MVSQGAALSRLACGSFNRRVAARDPSRIPGVRWDGAAGAFFFVDPKDDMFVVFMMQAPSEG